MEEKKQNTDLDNIGFYKSLKGKEAFKERVEHGRQPIIDIAGHPFFVSVFTGLLQPKDNFETLGIDVNALPKDPITKQLFFYYHIPTMERVNFPDDIKELPKDVVGVWIPNIYYLDPVGMARKNGKEPDYYTGDGITLRMYRKAKIVPLKNTPLAAIVARNNAHRTDTLSNKPAQKIKQKRRRPGL